MSENPMSLKGNMVQGNESRQWLVWKWSWWPCISKHTKFWILFDPSFSDKALCCAISSRSCDIRKPMSQNQICKKKTRKYNHLWIASRHSPSRSWRVDNKSIKWWEMIDDYGIIVLKVLLFQHSEQDNVPMQYCEPFGLKTTRTKLEKQDKKVKK